VRLLAVTGLTREAKLLAGTDVVVVSGGGRSEALERALALAARDCSAVISIGLAGALAEDLVPGDWVVADGVLVAGERLAVDAPWRDSLLARLPAAKAGLFLGSDAMMTSAADKRQAHAATGAIAVDMESHLAAQVARRFGLPFAAARVISDAADRSLPPAVNVGLRPDGGMALGPVLAALARDPLQLPALIRTGLEAGAAFRGLGSARRLLGPRLGLVDFLDHPLDVG
jgi:hopanoid-associated phosphorylase